MFWSPSMTETTNKKIPLLVVEDNKSDFEAIQRGLDRCGLRNPFYHCGHGDAAIDWLAGEGDYADRTRYPLPGIMLLDLNLPGSDGIDVLERVKSDDGLKAITVIVLTSSESVADVRQCYEHGVNSYVSKPVDVYQLYQALAMIKGYWFDTAELPRIYQTKSATKHVDSDH